ncbi:hypothetical protein GCM10007421_02480 [Halopseudomonas oceani]|uniref:Uncharacterized protein n=1 Tax=Halopseudomonas oceani TaxID=1708783 RepID=A0A2P4EXN6_9GAMM|nr:hypothetical protein [Halopseudomonas oceani]POB04995.1 hypothetical protein C1949_04255 [Halopseudomonas oceani]GGE32255.1 hypothetical protein GCM10007421_02480 [Halopseudomonas oceani]
MSQLAYGVLTLTLIAASLWLWRQRTPLATPAGGAITAALLGLGLAAAASLLLSLGALAQELEHTQRILGLAAQNISLPLLGLAAFFLGRGLQWQPAMWGRILLGLMAAFELLRRMDQLFGYQWAINSAAVLFMLIGCLLVFRQDRRALPAALLCALGTLAPLLKPGTAPLADLFAPGQTLLWLFPALLGAALTVGLLSEQAHNRAQPVSADHLPRS